MISSSVEKEKIKKYIIKSNEICKKKVLIVNNEKEDNFNMLRDILCKISKMTDIEKIYSSDVYIISSNENKTLYKKMLIDNPQLYFSNMIFKSTLPSTSSIFDKKTIFIFNKNYCKEISKIVDNNKLHLIVLSDLENGFQLYKALGKNTVLMSVIKQTKKLQKELYNLVNKIVKCEQIVSYFDIVKDERNKNIFVKDDELRYN